MHLKSRDCSVIYRDLGVKEWCRKAVCTGGEFTHTADRWANTNKALTRTGLDLTWPPQRLTGGARTARASEKKIGG